MLNDEQVPLPPDGREGEQNEATARLLDIEHSCAEDGVKLRDVLGPALRAAIHRIVGDDFGPSGCGWSSQTISCLTVQDSEHSAG